MEFLAKDGPRLPLHPIVTDKGHRYGAGHDEGQARIPSPRPNAGEIEKVEDLRRIGHAG